MKPLIEIDWRMIEEALASALSCPAKRESDFFHDFRADLRRALARRLYQKGIRVDLGHMPQYVSCISRGSIVHLGGRVNAKGRDGSLEEELDSMFCLKYGFDDHSLGALNYLDRTFCSLPSAVPFGSVEGFTIGNLLLAQQGKMPSTVITTAEGIHLTGYVCGRTPKSKVSYLALLGLWFDTDHFAELAERLRPPCLHEHPHLDEIRIGMVQYPMTWICRRCGKLFTCSCFGEHLSLEYDLVRYLPYANSDDELRDWVRGIETLERLCHLCNGGHPRLQYGHEMYYSRCLQTHLPYFTLFCRRVGPPDRWYADGEYTQNCQRLPVSVPDSQERHDLEEFFERIRQEQEAYKRRVENQVRVTFGFPPIGERWRQETKLFRIVKSLFTGTDVMHHYRGKELEGQELDIWLPHLKLGIEYQGEQHFIAMQHLGGQPALEERTRMDERKRQRCAQLGYNLVEFRYDQDISETSIRQQLGKWLSDVG